MAYGDFTLDALEQRAGLALRRDRLYTAVQPVEVPPWLRETLELGGVFALNEKSRSEFVVAPVLLACRRLCQDRFTIYSGERLDVDPDRGLVGECDFFLSLSEPMPFVRPPVVVLVEAKRGDIDLGIGQCAAQMVGAGVFNERHGRPALPIHGCVTSGDNWLFLRLDGAVLTIDLDRYYLTELGKILAIFQTIIASYPPEAAAA